MAGKKRKRKSANLCTAQNMCFYNKKYFLIQMMFFSVLVIYSAFVLTSVGTKYYTRPSSQVFEYYVYIWGAGDLLEEFIVCCGCFVSWIVNIQIQSHTQTQVEMCVLSFFLSFEVCFIIHVWLFPQNCNRKQRIMGL